MTQDVKELIKSLEGYTGEIPKDNFKTDGTVNTVSLLNLCGYYTAIMT